MDPFSTDPYDSGSDEEDGRGFPWAGSVASEHATPIMHGDFEVSPLVPAVPPMPEGKTTDHAPGIPSFSRNKASLALKKRKVEKNEVGMAQAFGQTHGVASSSDSPPNEQSQHHRPPPPLPRGFGIQPKQHAPRDMFAAARQEHDSAKSPGSGPLLSGDRVVPTPIPGQHGKADQASGQMHPPPAIQHGLLGGHTQSSLNAVSQTNYAPLHNETLIGQFSDPRKDSREIQAAANLSSLSSSGLEKDTSGQFSSRGDNSDHDKSGVLDDTDEGNSKSDRVKGSPRRDEESLAIGKNSIGDLSPAQRPSIRDIVLGSTKPSPQPDGKAPLKEEATKSAAAMKQEQKPASTASTDNNSTKKKTGHALNSRKVKKVFVAKKEREQAFAMLRDKDQLMDCLEKEDCLFLAEKFWIFTVQQLSFVLGLDETEETIQNEKAAAIRADIVAEMTKGSHSGPDVGNSIVGDTDVDSTKVDPQPPGSGEPALVASHEDAVSRLQTWKDRIQEFWKKGGNFARTAVEDRFPLDGPISCIIPLTTRNFLASVPITKIFRFLSLKKTETGAICELFRAWRKECGQQPMMMIALAKHMLGVAARVEMVLSAIPPVDANARRWIKDPIIVMTGAAREFIVEEQGINTAAEFCEFRTKTLAERLAAWRERKGLTPLKGSGKVAMISGWKATAREADEAERLPGKILDSSHLASLASLDCDLTPGDKDTRSTGSSKKASSKEGRANKKAKTSDSRLQPLLPKSQAVPPGDRQTQYALHTKLFLEDVLGDDVTTFLTATGITTAAELFNARSERDSPLTERILDAGRAENTSECDSLIKSWCDKLESELDQLRPKRKAESAPAAVPQPAKKPKKPKASGATKGQNQKQSISRELVDPFGALSASSKQFLATLDIVTAEQFLTTRTTDVASRFVTWRSERGMAELKGLGAIASVSGWKAAVRKAANELGRPDIAVLEPTDKSSWGPYSRGIAGNVQKQSITSAAPLPQPIPAKSNERSLVPQSSQTSGDFARTGTLKCPMAFAGSEVPFRQYQFELSVRRRSEQSDPALFLTYNGVAVDSEHPRKRLVLPNVRISGPELSEISVMQEVPLQLKSKQNPNSVGIRWAPFSSLRPGLGLIDLAAYNVRPMQNQDLSVLKTELEEFVLSGDKKMRQSKEYDSPKHNVLISRQGLGKCSLFFYVTGNMEKGQTVQLCFPTSSFHLLAGSRRDSQFSRRHLLEESLHLLSMDDLQTIRKYIEGELLDAIGWQDVVESLQSDSLGPCGVSNGLRDSFTSSCRRRRRLHWVAKRLSHVMQDDALRDAVFFGPSTLENITSIVPELLDTASDAFRTEVKAELLSIIELDRVSDSRSRTVWCNVARRTFDVFVDGFLDNYCRRNDDPTDLLANHFKSCIHEVLPFVAEKTVPAELAVCCPDPEAENCSLFSPEMIAKMGHFREKGSTHGEVDGGSSNGTALKCVVCRQNNIKEEGGSRIAADTADNDIILASPSDMEKMHSRVHIEFYHELQWNVSMKVISATEVMLSVNGLDSLLKDLSTPELKNVWRTAAGTTELKDAVEDVAMPLVLRCNIHQVSDDFQPHSFQFFLGIVWPTLHNYGWRLDAGALPSDVTFVAPDVKTLSTSKADPIKRKRDQSRARMAREINRIGFGNAVKLTKRLLISLIPHSDADLSLEDSESDLSKGATAKLTLERFQDYVADGLDKDDDDGKLAVKKIVNALLECFVEVAPLLTRTVTRDEDLDDEDERNEPSSPTMGSSSPDTLHKSNSGEFGSDILVRLLLLLPNILRQSGLPLNDVYENLDLIDELLEFITSAYRSIFNKEFHPPVEHYVPSSQKRPARRRLTARLKQMYETAAKGGQEAATDSNGDTDVKEAGEMKELIRKEDAERLTDFLVLVLGQAIPVRASAKDAAKKYRRIKVGYPGFACRHCYGHQEGRYFFTTIESLTTASTVFEKHVMKCDNVPPDIKTKVAAARKRQQEQRKLLPQGSQQAYFNKLWDRLRSCKIEGVEAGVYILEGYSAKGSLGDSSMTGDGGEDGSPSNLEFKNHIDILQFIRTTNPWKGNGKIQEALNQYYNCLGYGGRIYHTSSMPEHFSSEWLLGKIVPRAKTLSKKNKLMPG